MDKNRPEIVFQMIVVLIGIALFFSGLACHFHVTLKDLICVMTEGLYIPGHNICGVGYLKNHSMNFYFYVAIFVISGFLYLSQFLSTRLARRNQDRVNNVKILPAVSLILLFFIVCLQTIQQQRYLNIQELRFANKSLEERHAALFGYSYYFAQFCLKYLSGRHFGELITDYNLDKTLEPYALGYYLYPVVDILVDKNPSRDCLIVFNRINAKDAVPVDFRIVAVFDQRSLLAVRKKD